MKQFDDGSWGEFEAGDVIGSNVDPGWSGPPILIISVGDGDPVPISGTAAGTPRILVRIGTLTRPDYSNYPPPGSGAEPMAPEVKDRLEREVRMYNEQGIRVQVGYWTRVK